MNPEDKNSDFEKYLSTEGSPIVVICTFTNKPEKIGRGIGFIFEKISDTSYLAVTCKHVFENLKTHNKGFVVASHYQYQNPPTMLKPITAPIEMKDDVLGRYLDIAFLVLEISNPDQRVLSITSGDPEIVRSSQTFYVVSAREANTITKSFVPYIMRQKNGTTEQTRGFSRDGKSFEFESVDCTKKRRFNEKKYSQFRIFNLVSRAGCSGSPLVDSYGRMYGLVRGGTSPGEENHRKYGDLLFAVPTSDLIIARASMQPKLDRLLAKL